MRGHDAIVALRRQGLKPDLLLVEGRVGKFAPPSAAEIQRDGMTPWVEIEPSDVPEMTDLRWSVGIDIHLSEFDSSRLTQWADRFLLAKARSVSWYCPEARKLHKWLS